MSEEFAPVEQKTVTVSADQTAYGGFWLRAVAFVIDNVILSIPTAIISIPLLGYAMFNLLPYLEEYDQTEIVSSEMAAALFLFWSIGLLLQVIWMLCFWLYFALFESSAKQATWGKQIVGLRVTDGNGQRISFARASGRTFAKFISYIIFYIGFMMAGWTKRKRALHDIIADTLVIRTH